MPYDARQGWIAMTVEEITDMLRIGVNQQFGTNYTSSNFVGSGFWRLFMPVIELVKNFENNMVGQVAHFKDIVNALPEDFFSAIPGLEKGILKAIKSLPEVANAAIYNPGKLSGSNPSFRGKISVAIRTVDDIDTDPNDPAVINVKQKIANTLVNNVGAGIATDSDQYTYSMLGVMEHNGEVKEVFWKRAEPVDIDLQLQYKPNEGATLPSLEEIKKTLLDSLAQYEFGTRFTPSLHANLCDFPYFREVHLLWKKSQSKEFKNSENTPKPDTYFELWQFSADRISIVLMTEEDAKG